MKEAPPPRQQATGFGLPCAKCHRYFSADLDECPICKSRERVAPVAPPRDPALRKGQAFAAPPIASASQPQPELPKRPSNPQAPAQLEPGKAPASTHAISQPQQQASTADSTKSPAVPLPGPLSAGPDEDIEQLLKRLAASLPASAVMSTAPVLESHPSGGSDQKDSGPPAAPPMVEAPQQATSPVLSLERERDELVKELGTPVFVISAEGDDSPLESGLPQSSQVQSSQVQSSQDQSSLGVLPPLEGNASKVSAATPEASKEPVISSDSPPSATLEETQTPIRNADLPFTDLALRNPIPDLQFPETPQVAAATSVGERGFREPSSVKDHSSTYPTTVRPVSRGFDVMTVALGVIVLGFAVLLTVLTVVRLGGFRGATNLSRSSQDSATAAQSSAQNEAASNSGGAAPVASSPESSLAGKTSPADSDTSEPKNEVPSAPRSSHVPASAGTPDRNAKNESPQSLSATPAPAQNAKTAEPPTALSTPAVRPVMLSQDVAESNLLHRVEPDYPDDALARGIQGSVVLDLYIRKDGTVQSVGLVSGPAPLVGAATSAVRQWQFKPFVVNGKPVAAETRIALGFTLSH